MDLRLRFEEFLQGLPEKFEQQPEFEQAWIPFVASLLLTVVFLYPPVWSKVRYLITVVHEFGHAIVGIFTGAGLKGIKIHSGSAGVTESTRKKGLFGWLTSRLMTYVGYPFPAFVAVMVSVSVHTGYAMVSLFTISLLLTLVLLFMRNIRGIFVGLILVIGSWSLFNMGSPEIVQTILMVWVGFLLTGGVTTVVELHKHHRNGDTENSDVQAITYGFPPMVLACLLSYYFIYVASFAIILQTQFGITP